MAIELGDSDIGGIGKGGLPANTVQQNNLESDLLRNVPHRIYENDLASIWHPQGASYSSNSTSGAFKIRFPYFGNEFMIRMRICMYIYNGSQPFILECGGHGYQGDLWTNEFAHYFGGTGRSNLNVRFGHDGSRSCIWVGDTSDSWSYPKIHVEHIMLSFRNQDLEGWKTGWDIQRVTSFDTVRETISVNNQATVSDIEIKDNLEKIENPLSKIKNLTGYYYDRTDNIYLGRQTGLIAQEVNTVLPQAVRGNIDKQLFLNYDNMSGLFVEGIKELDSQVSDTENLIEQIHREK